MRPARRPARGTGLAGVVVLANVSAILLALLAFPKTRDDAYIAFRYALNFVHGYPLGTWNVGQPPVEGYTSLVWVLLLSLVMKIGWDPWLTIKGVGIVCYLVAVNIPFWLASEAGSKRFPLLKGIPRWVFAASGLGYALYLPASYYAASGMEAPLFALLALVVAVFALGETKGCATAAGLATVAIVLTRPEGIAVAICAHAVAAVLKKQSHASWSANAVGLLLALLTMGGLVAFRLARFGFVFPNAYYAKAVGAQLMHLRYGLSYALRWSVTYPWIGLAGLLGVLAVLNRRDWRGWLPGDAWFIALSGALLLYGAYIVKAGGDEPSAFPLWRHFAHIAPLLVLEACIGIGMLLRSRPVAAVLTVTACSIVSAFSIVPRYDYVVPNARTLLTAPSRLFQEPQDAYVAWFQRYGRDDCDIAARAVGRLGYDLPECSIIDELSLNDVEGAHHGRFNRSGPIDSKTDIVSVLARRPAFVDAGLTIEQLLPPSPRPIGHPLSNDLEALLHHTTFCSDYLLVVNGPYDYWDRAIFIRRDYWGHNPRRQDIRVLPVGQTALAKVS